MNEISKPMYRSGLPLWERTKVLQTNLSAQFFHMNVFVSALFKFYLLLEEACTLPRQTFMVSAWWRDATQCLKIPVPFSSSVHFTNHSKCLFHRGLGESPKSQKRHLFLWAPLRFLSLATPRKKTLKKHQNQNQTQNSHDWKERFWVEKVSQSKKAFTARETATALWL